MVNVEQAQHTEPRGETSCRRQKSQLSRAFAEDGACKTHIGGQALIEGVMMRGKLNWAAAVREPDGGIYVEEHDLASGKHKNRWLRFPLVRGCTALVESLMLGFKALEIAANHAFSDEDEEPGKDAEAAEDAGRAGASQKASACAAMRAGAEPAAFATAELQELGSPEAPKSAGAASNQESVDFHAEANAQGDTRAQDRGFSWRRDFGNPDEMIDALGAQRTLEVVSEPTTPAAPDPKQSEPVFSSLEMGITLALGLGLGIVLFIVAPAFLTNLIVGEYDQNTLTWNIVDGILRVAVFVFYLWLIGRMKDVKRMFMYHGAEHKTIHCFEHGLPLTPENARRFPRLHVRCGTAFLVMVIIIAIFVYTVIPLNALISAWGVPDGAPKLLLVIASRIILMPVIAGVSYEITVKWAGSHPDNPLVKVVLWPGMQMQYLTTNEPDDEQLECAIAAMKAVVDREERAKRENASASATPQAA